MLVGTTLPLLNKVLEGLNYSRLIGVVEAVKALYKFLRERSPEFAEACSIAAKEGVKLALRFLRTVLNKIIELCKQNNVLITHLSKLVAKGVARAGAIAVGSSTKVAVKFGAGKVASQSVKTVLKFTNPAGMVVDVAQAGLEVTGHREIGKTVGMWGNIGTGAVAGAALGGPVGAPVGALVGFGTWVIGEAVGLAIEDSAS